MGAVQVSSSCYMTTDSIDAGRCDREHCCSYWW